VSRIFDVFADVPAAAMPSNELGAEEDTNCFIIGPDDNGLTDEVRRYRIQVSVEAHAKTLRDAGAFNLIRLIVCVAQRPEQLD
jgi:hypothetical protein